MNRIILMGRLTKDPEIYYSQGDAPTAIARFSIAVDKKQKREDGITADFFQMVSFGKAAEFAEKYLHKGMKMLFAGRVQTGRYEKDGVSIPFFQVVVEEQEFAESKDAYKNVKKEGKWGIREDENGYLSVPEGIDAELPFD